MTAARRSALVTAVVAVPGLFAVALALLGPFLAAGRSDRSSGAPFRRPGPGLALGADHLGRDVLAVLLDGGTTLVLLPVLATLLGTAVGVALGLLTGWYPGRAAAAVTRAGELLLAIPPLLLTVLAVYAFADSGLAVLVSVVALLGVPATVRYARAATVTVAGRGYVDHAVALGESTPAVLVREVLPAMLGPVLADAGLRLVAAVYVVASLGFLGVIDAGDAGWAGMIADNITGAGLNVWAVLAPAACIVAFAVSVNLVADRLADRFRRSG